MSDANLCIAAVTGLTLPVAAVSSTPVSPIGTDEETEKSMSVGAGNLRCFDDLNVTVVNDDRRLATA